MKRKTKVTGLPRQAVQSLEREAALSYSVALGKLLIPCNAQFNIVQMQGACCGVNESTGCMKAGAAAISLQG